MHKFTSIACSLLLIMVNTMAQQQSTQPIKNKSNRIVMHFKDTSGLFTSFAKTLIDRGYEIEEKDRELGTLKTAPSSVPSGYSHKQQIKAVFRDSTITISGASYSGGYKFDTFYTAKNRKNIVDLSWQEMMTVCALLKPETITYTEQ